MVKQVILTVFAVCMVSAMAFAQGTNEGATVTAPFLVTPPVIDGVVSDGEWDAAGVTEEQWTQHDAATPEDANYPTQARVAYSVNGLYILFECVDDMVLAGAGGSEFLGSGPSGIEGQGQPFTFGGDTDYLAVYIDPTNYADDLPSSSLFSYSIQTEPAVTFTEGEEESSYTYTEVGQFGAFKRLFNPPVVDADGNTVYWANGVSWELDGAQIVDGPTENGYVTEFFIPWTDLSGYYANWASQVLEGIADVGLDATDPFNVENGISRAILFAEDGTPSYAGFGAVTGMPMPGTQWKIQFCRYSAESVPQYVNWVGDTGGFVSRPFGNLVFGDAPATAVRDAIMHMASQ